jgi:hypothetical protein
VRRALVIVALAACGKGSGPTGSGARDTVVDAWKKGGLEVSELKATTSPVGKDCAQGTVAKVDVLVCSFGSADEAKAAEDLGLQWVGDTTGRSQAKGSVVIAVADRKKADPNGKTINQIFKLVPQ